MCAAPVIRTGGSPSVVSIAHAHLGQRVGDAPHRPAADALVAVQRERALLAGQQAGQQAHQRAGVADVDRALRRAQPAEADAVDHAASSRPAARSRRPSPGTPPPSRACPPRRRTPSTRTRPSASEPSITLRWLTDLSPGTASSPNSPPAGPTRSSVRSGIDRRGRDGAVALGVEQLDGALRLASRRRSCTTIVPPRSADMWCSSKSSMLMPSAPSAWAIPEITPGRSGTWTRTRNSSSGVAG